MRIAAVFVVLAALVLPVAAATGPADDLAPNSTVQESTTADLFRAFDLFGTWASDCGRPPSPANPHVSVAVADGGLVFETHDVGPAYAANHYNVLSALRVADDQLEVKVIFQPGTPAEQHQTLVMLVRNGTRRTIFNEVEGGIVRVKNGVVLAAGLKTPLLRKCG